MTSNLAELIASSGIGHDLHVDMSGPLDLLDVKFNGQLLEPGHKFSKDQVKSEPKVKYVNAKNDGAYLLMMVDPDAPSRENPIKRSWLHWMVINIKGHETSHGETKCSFNPSTPPPTSGFHRYVFLMFKQDGKLINVHKYSNRGNFDVAEFVTKAHLGKPVAVNFYEARHEPF